LAAVYIVAIAVLWGRNAADPGNKLLCVIVGLAVGLVLWLAWSGWMALGGLDSLWIMRNISFYA